MRQHHDASLQAQENLALFEEQNCHGVLLKLRVAVAETLIGIGLII
jgi:hypothetical protein